MINQERISADSLRYNQVTVNLTVEGHRFLKAAIAKGSQTAHHLSFCMKSNCFMRILKGLGKPVVRYFDLCMIIIGL
jgi:hypothetical protein